LILNIAKYKNKDSIMKSFKEYLTESKKVYEFKLKIAGDHAKDAVAQIKAALAEFHVATVSSGRTTPISERQLDFPEHRNTQMTVYDITTSYPATALQIRDRIASGLAVTHNHIKIASLAEELENELNHAHDERTGKALGGTMQEPSDNGHLVNEKHKYDLLKDLAKTPKTLTQYKGVNDKILATGQPGMASEYKKSVAIQPGIKSALGSTQNKIPNPFKGITK
jgi:hypothetical protein